MYRLRRPRNRNQEQEQEEIAEPVEPKGPQPQPQFHSPVEQLIKLQQKFEQFKSSVETDSPLARFSPSKIALSELSDRFIELESNITHGARRSTQLMSERLVFSTLLASSWAITVVTVLHVFGLI